MLGNDERIWAVGGAVSVPSPEKREDESKATFLRGEVIELLSSLMYAIPLKDRAFQAEAKISAWESSLGPVGDTRR